MIRRTGTMLLVAVLFVGMSTCAAIQTSVVDHGGESFSPVVSSSGDDHYDMVVIAPGAFSRALQPFVEHKDSHGVSAFVKPVEDIYAAYEGRDRAERVKYFIKDAIEQWNTDYVLLVGGKKGQLFDWHVPVRYVQLDDDFFRYPYYLSDLYFADVYRDNGTAFEDWDSNDNGVFGEFQLSGKDVLDLEPDVAVGRLPCRNRFEVQIMVEKIIDYETGTYGRPGFNRMVLAGGDTNPSSGDVFPYEGEIACDVAAGYMDGFETIKLYTSDGTLTGPDVVVDAINQGCGFLFFSGHGSTTAWGNYLPGGSSFVQGIRTDDMLQLKNDMYPVCVVSACDTGKFDVCLGNYLNQQDISQQDCVLECLSWRLTHRYHGGTIATIASTSTPWGYVGDKDDNGIFDGIENGLAHWLTVEFFRLYGEEGKRTLGDVYATAIANYVDTFPVMENKLDCKTVQEFVLLGDPSLRIGGYASTYRGRE